MIAQIFVRAVAIQFFVLIAYGQEDLSSLQKGPGVMSIKKCNEYYNATLQLPQVWPMTEQELEYIRRIESGYVPPGAFLGGSNARPGQLRFIAALGYGNGTEKQYLCGGSLINPEFVLTAAHCLYTTALGYVKYVRLGDLNLTSTEDDQWVQELEVKEYFAHPKYEYPKKYHDIALLRLNKPANLTDYVQIICLHPRREYLLYSTLYAAGWGTLGHGAELSSHLQVGDLSYFYIKDCRNVYNTSFEIPEGIMDDFQICAGGKTKISDTCAGDSGGPLFYINKGTGVEQLIGITSFGKPCGTLNIPGIYTRITYYLDWIEKIVWPDNN